MLFDGLINNDEPDTNQPQIRHEAGRRGDWGTFPCCSFAGTVEWNLNKLLVDLVYSNQHYTTILEYAIQIYGYTEKIYIQHFNKILFFTVFTLNLSEVIRFHFNIQADLKAANNNVGFELL